MSDETRSMRVGVCHDCRGVYDLAGATTVRLVLEDRTVDAHVCQPCARERMGLPRSLAEENAELRNLLEFHKGEMARLVLAQEGRGA